MCPLTPGERSSHADRKTLSQLLCRSGFAVSVCLVFPLMEPAEGLCVFRVVSVKPFKCVLDPAQLMMREVPAVDVRKEQATSMGNRSVVSLSFGSLTTRLAQFSTVYVA